MAELKEKAKTLQVEINEFKEQRDKKAVTDSAVKPESIKTLEDQLKTVGEKADKISAQVKELEDFKKTALEKDIKNKDKVFTTVDMVDGKILSVYEKLKNENQMIWKDSLLLAEK